MEFELESSSSSSASSSSPPSSSPSNSSSQASRATSHKRKAGRKKFKETRHPIYRGVRQRNGQKWVCEVREPMSKKTRIWVGTFPTPEMAARAHDVAALALHGDLAALNFIDSAWLLPRAESSSSKDIQAAASALLRDKRLLDASVHCVQSKKKVLKPLSLDVFCGETTESSEDVPQQPRSTFFLDEEALFNMPGLLDSMAEGLILTPPAMQRGFGWDDLAANMDLTLWY
ncbi:hypothetical protein FH972_010074 [Carpinus fangiana]|uniref:AP2/ERF domain-containing protein n=1 Tax=Carpinus fangiana TaxID=176857 RepID=A0A660KPX8_9ROSI|nr:hypothetical protein FH972_010074 [Carpinus fangiana]